MRIETKPLLHMEASITLNNEEWDMLNTLFSFGEKIIEGTIETVDPEDKERWSNFISSIKSKTIEVSNRFYRANQVFQGFKDIE